MQCELAQVKCTSPCLSGGHPSCGPGAHGIGMRWSASSGELRHRGREGAAASAAMPEVADHPRRHQDVDAEAPREDRDGRRAAAAARAAATRGSSAGSPPPGEQPARNGRGSRASAAVAPRHRLGGRAPRASPWSRPSPRARRPRGAQVLTVRSRASTLGCSGRGSRASAAAAVARQPCIGRRSHRAAGEQSGAEPPGAEPAWPLASSRGAEPCNGRRGIDLVLHVPCAEIERGCSALYRTT
jgi:hypothetical protein